MKVIILTPNINEMGGVERVLNLTCNYLVENFDYSIEIISLSKNDDKEPFFTFDERIKLTYTNEDIRPVIKNKLDLIMTDFKVGKSLLEVLKDKECDIILSTTQYINFGLLVFKHKIKSKIIISEHGSYYATSRLSNLKRKFLYRKANKLIVLTSKTKKLYDRYLNNAVVINNPKSFKTSQVSNQVNKRIISAGRLEKEKGFDRLIEVFNDEKMKLTGYTLDIYGDGREKESLVDKINEYGLESTINIYPFTKDIKSKMLNSDIYLLPSRAEGFGMVLIEAMECGLPCISFDLLGLDEIIKNDQNGFLVECDNINAFRNKLKELIENHDKRREMSNNAKENAKRFDIEVIGEKYNELFKNT